MDRIRLSLFAIMAPVLTCMGEEIYPGYDWQVIGGGVYLHTRTDPLAGPVDGNSVVIANDEGVFVVDTQINPAAARAVIGQIRSITDRPVTHVINTHWHDDHTNGNHAYREAYPDAKIVSHQATLAALKKEWRAMEDQRKTNYAAVEPEQLIAAADALEDRNQAMAYRVYAGYVAALKPELDAMQLIYPDTVFEDRLVFQQGERRIELAWLGRGNTDGDVVVWLPDDDILITGDLLVAPVPFAFDSPMTDWIATLDEIAAFDAATIIPGHGPALQDSGYLEQLQILLQVTVDAVREAHEAGVAYDELTDHVDLSEQEALFTGGDADHVFAWRSYYLEPGLKSAWSSLGYAIPAE